MRNKKKIIIISILMLLLGATGVFVYGSFGGGQSGPDAAPNLAEYGLVGYWNMEEGKGQTVYDRSGNGNNGTLGASTAVAKDDPVFTGGYSSAGAGGTALKFDGKDDYVSVPDSPIFDTGGQITIMLWFKTSVQQYSKPFLYHDYSSYKYKLEISAASGDIQWRLKTTSGETMVILDKADGYFSDNQWHFVVGVYSKPNLYIYVDSFNNSATGYNEDILDGDEGIDVSRSFNGTIDEVKIYNRALSADEIRQHYNQKKPILEWKFDEGSGTTTRDESFNNNDGTLHE